MAFCVQLFLKGRRVLVAGGGRLGLRRARQLAREGAAVTVVSPRFLPEFEGNGWELIQDFYSPVYLDGCFLAAAATGDPKVDQRVVREASACGVLALAAGTDEAADLRVLKSSEEGGLLLACSTGGAFPALNRPLLEEMKRAAAPFAARLPLLRQLRQQLLARGDGASRALLPRLASLNEEELRELLAREKGGETK